MSDFDDIDLEDSVKDEEPSTEASVDVSSEAYSITARQKTRDQLTRDMEEFMKRGGQVQQIANDVRADPPRKPSTDYGSSPI